jgi:cysteine desulfurase
VASDRPLYFDWAATAPLRDEARDAWLKLSAASFGNASSLHQWGQRARAELQRARRSFATALGCERDDLCFTGNGSEANLLGLAGAVAALPTDRRHVLVSAIEHPSVLGPLERLARAGAIELETLPVDSFGRVDPVKVEARCRPTTGLVALQAANHEIGTLQPVAQVAARLRSRHVLIHCDATQALGKIPCSLEALGCDLLVASPHKFGGPRGVGVLARRSAVMLKTPLSPERQEQGLRGGTEDVAAIVAAAVALEAALEEQAALSSRLSELTRHFATRLAALLPDITLHSTVEYGLPGLLNVSVPGLRGDWLVTELDRRAVAVSHGSACASLAAVPSPVLVAIGAAGRAKESVRVSMGRSTTRDDVDELVTRLVAAVVQLRR